MKPPIWIPKRRRPTPRHARHRKASPAPLPAPDRTGGRVRQSLLPGLLSTIALVAMLLAVVAQGRFPG